MNDEQTTSKMIKIIIACCVAYCVIMVIIMSFNGNFMR
jgi:hypothetical protein